MIEKYMIFYYDGFKIKAPGYQKIYAKEERKNGKSYDVGARDVYKRQGCEFDVSKRTIAATKLQEGDAVVAVHAAPEQAHVVLATKGGYFLRFPVSEVPIKKKTAVGVRGMKLSEKDEITDVYWLEGTEVPEVTYHDKPVSINRLRISSRDTKGTKTRL